MRHLWFPQVLRAAGLTVVEVPGWKTRGPDGLLELEVLVTHHTATSDLRQGDYPSLEIVRDGRSDLEGPLSQLGLGRSGTWYVIASGKANHAGVGDWKGFDNSRRTIGVEAEYSGSGPWPEAQLQSYKRGVAAILKHEALSASRVCAHREWALPPGRKIDPANINMDQFRYDVATLIRSDLAAVATERTLTTKEEYMHELVIDETKTQYVVGAFGVRRVTSTKALAAIKNYGYIMPGPPRVVTRSWIESMSRATDELEPVQV